MARALNEAESTKKRLQVENQDLNRQIEELEAAIANMNKGKISVTTQLEDSKALADAEAKDRAALLTKFKMMSTDLENLREKLENEAMRKSDALKSLKVLVLSFKPRLSKMKSLLMFSRLRLPMMKNQRVDLDQTLMIFQWNMKEFMLQPLSPRSVQRPLIRFLVNGFLRHLMLLPNSFIYH